MFVLLVCGSLRAGSTNLAVLRTAHALDPAGTELYERLGDLPHFNPDDDREPLHPAVVALRQRLGACGAVLFCAPEYAGALPGSFKNLLDWTVGGGETYGKPVAWINVSGPASPTGGAAAHDSLRAILGYTGSDIVEAACLRLPLTRDVVGEDGLVADPAARERIAAALLALARHARLRATYAAFNVRDIDAVLAQMADDVDWPNAWQGGRLRGRKEVREYWTRQWAEIDPAVEPLSLEPRPDGRVAVEVAQTVRSLDGALLDEGRVVHVYTFADDGRVARMDVEEP